MHYVCLLTIPSIRKKQLGSYNAALLSICFILLLGFIDDVLELRWSVKILLSFVGTLPLLVEYSGPTLIIVPKPLVSILGNSLPLGSLQVSFDYLFASQTLPFTTLTLDETESLFISPVRLSVPSVPPSFGGILYQ